jgi:hypothetical protein
MAADGHVLDIANLAASWISAIVTAVGLMALIAQASFIKAQLDPFYMARGRHHLGRWAKHRKEGFSLMALFARPPNGPVIKAQLTGLCGMVKIHMSRRPLGNLGEDFGTASWTTLLKVFHPSSLCDLPSAKQVSIGIEAPEKDVEKSGQQRDLGDLQNGRKDPLTWEAFWETGLRSVDSEGLHRTQDLVEHDKKACLTISRTTLVTLLVTANAYQCYLHNGDSGLRVMYSGYTGSWQITWPIGQPAVVEFLGLDSHTDLREDFYPKLIPRRVDKCILMFMGVICGRSVGKIGFPEPQEQGRSVLEFHPQGFTSHSACTHLYSMMGGTQYEVDFLLRRSLPERDAAPEGLPLTIPTPELDENRRPCGNNDRRGSSIAPSSTLYVPPAEEKILAEAMDCLPWSSLSWSVHRGMQSILIAYGRNVMSTYRKALANTLEHAVASHAQGLIDKGWKPNFVRKQMGPIARSAVAEAGGDSGDTVRIVTDVALLCCPGMSEADLDDTKFWRNLIHKTTDLEPVLQSQLLDADTVAALVKYFVLAWSNELDHELYVLMPFDLLVA